jgi:two-component system, NarL family, nitrate/nitrite response regulator NarL
MVDAPSSSFRLALVSEDPLARGALARTLSDQAEGWAVVAGTQVELETTRGEPPDVVLWDTGLRLEEGAAPDLGAPVLALVADEAAGELALGAGARAVACGLTVFEPGLSQVRAAPRSTAPSGASGPDTLTPREREVLGLLAEGLSNKAIADRLDISEHTAKFHVNAVLTKLGVQRRTEAVVRAARMGLVTL